MAAPSVGVRITGLNEVRKLLGNVGAGASVWQRTRIGAGSNLPYAYWIEEGHYYGGRPGSTRAVHYMARAMAAVLPTVAPALYVALPKGGPAVSAAATKLSQDVANLGQQYVTVRSGRLRSSIQSNRGQTLRGMG